MSKARPIAHKMLTCCSQCCRQFAFPRLRGNPTLQTSTTRPAAKQALEAGGARGLGNESFISAPQLKRGPLGGTSCSDRSSSPGSSSFPPSLNLRVSRRATCPRRDSFPIRLPRCALPSRSGEQHMLSQQPFVAKLIAQRDGRILFVIHYR